jgi:hypothetical protein
MVEVSTFSNQAQGLFFICMFAIWFVALWFTFVIRGKNGNIIGFFNIMQCFFGIFLGLKLISISFMLSAVVIFIASGVFIGQIMAMRR